MPCRHLLVLLFFLSPLASPVCRGQEEEVLGKKRSEWLTILKTHKEPKFRRAAVIALGAIGPRAVGVLDGFYDAVANDADPEVRRDIIHGLARMGSEAKGAVDVLGDVLKQDKSDIVREAAAVSLAGKFNEQAFTQVMALAGALKDAHAGTRAAAAEALKNMGEKAKIALPQLMVVAADKKADRFSRVYAIQIISKWSDDDAGVKLLLGVAQDGDSLTAVRQAAIEGLGRMGDKADAAIPGLVKALHEKDAELRRAAALALNQVGGKVSDSWPAIKDAFKDSDNAVRTQLIRLAGSLGKMQKEAIPLLVQAAQADANLENRLAALQELGRLESAALEAAPVLTSMAADDARASIREAAAIALRRIKGE